MAEGLAKSAEQKFSKFTLSKQTNTALVITLQCIAFLIEDLLMEKKIQICFNVSVANRLSGVKILEVQANEWWKIFIWFATNAGI